MIQSYVENSGIILEIIMRYRTFGKIGWQVSEIGLGSSKGLVEKASKEEGEHLVASAMAGGINFIDSARHYGGGEAEARIGQALKDFDRQKIYLASKCGTIPGGGRDFSRQAILNSFEESIKKLGTDYLDVYLLHMASGNLLKETSEAVEVLLELKEKGNVRHIGASVDGPDMWEALNNKYFDVLEISYNIADLYPEEGFFEEAEKKEVGLIIKEPLAVANFYKTSPDPPWTYHVWQTLQHYDFLKDESEMSAVEIALRFVLTSPYIHTAVQATSNIEHLRFNMGLSDGKGLDEKYCQLIRKYYSKYNQ